MGENTKLEPCPFCGRLMQLLGDAVPKWKHPLETEADVQCTGSTIEIFDNPVRVAAWNRRAPAAPVSVLGEVVAVSEGALRAAFMAGRESTFGTDRHNGDRAWENSHIRRALASPARLPDGEKA